jgi:putative transposase
MVKITEDVWYWHHNVSECYYHIQLTIKYRRSVFEGEIEAEMIGIMAGFKERYYIDVQTVGYDKNHVHILCRFLPKYSGGQVIRLIKSITARKLFEKFPDLKRQLWGGEYWSDGYYIGTVSGRGDRKIIENYIKKQGREPDVKQLKLFDI